MTDLTQAVAPDITETAGPERTASLWGDAWRDLRRKPSFLVPAFLLLLIVSMAAVPWLWTRQDPRDCRIELSKQGPSGAHPFGTNVLGCDYYAMSVHGARASILVAVLATTGVVLVGGLLGVLGGYFGGWAAAGIGYFVNVFLALPLLLGAVVVLSILHSHSIWPLILALVLLGCGAMSRYMRSSVIAAKDMDYVQAARGLGAGHGRIVFRHILPNAIAPVMVIATVSLGAYVAAEATLTYLGVGLQPPTVSWGIMINQGQDYIQEHPHLLLFPSLFLVVTVLSFILLGDALRDALDPKLR